LSALSGGHVVLADALIAHEIVSLLLWVVVVRRELRCREVRGRLAAAIGRARRRGRGGGPSIRLPPGGPADRVQVEGLSAFLCSDDPIQKLTRISPEPWLNLSIKLTAGARRRWNRRSD
jgi:hypothetical protein